MAPLEHAAIAHRTPLMRQSTLAPRIDARVLDNGSLTGTAAASRMAVPVTYRSSLVTRAPLPHEGGT